MALPHRRTGSARLTPPNHGSKAFHVGIMYTRSPRGMIAMAAHGCARLARNTDDARQVAGGAGDAAPTHSYQARVLPSDGHGT